MSSDGEEEFLMDIPNTSSSIRGPNNKLVIKIQMCRFCGKVGSNGAFIRLHYPSEHQVVIRNIRRELLECWKVKFSPVDGLPKHICQSCYLEFDSYFSFRDNYLESQNTLFSIYEDMQEKEIQKSICSRMEETQKNKITRDETHQRKMLHCITNDHNYLGSYEDFLKISTDDRLEQKLWKIKPKSFASTNESFGRNDANFTCQPETDYDRLQYDEELFSDSDQFNADEEIVEELESETIESQSLFENITDSVEIAYKNIENHHYIEFQADNENKEKIKSTDTVKEETIESQSQFENTTDSVELAQKDIENQSIVSERNEYDEKHTLITMYPKQELSTYSDDFSPVSFEHHLKSDATKWKLKMQTRTIAPVQEKTEELQSDSIESYTDNFVHFNALRNPVVQETSVSQTENTIKSEIQNESDEQIIEYDPPLDENLIESDSHKNLNVTIFVQDKTMETQMKSEIEKQILNLVETNKNDFENVNAMTITPKSGTNECILDNSTDTIFLKQEETKETHLHAKFKDQIDLAEPDIGNSENFTSASLPTELDTIDCNIDGPTKLIEERKIKTQIQIEKKSTKSNKKQRYRNYKHLRDTTDFAKKEKKKRNPYRLPFSCKFCVSDPDLLSKEVCDKYPTEEALTEHFHIEHDPELPYTCLVCKKKFKQYNTCRRHVFYKHKKPNVSCAICGVEFSAVKLTEHMERLHTIGDYQCEICHKEFKNISLTKFKYHQKWHNREQQLKCRFCNKSFVQQSHLQEHIMEQHTKDYKIKCEICGAGFSAQFKKYVHMAKMHGELKPLKCLYCDQRFLGYKLRVRHMIAFHDHIHNKSDEQSICLICKKVFANERGLSIHESIGCSGSTTYENINKDMYSCDFCPRQFKSKATLTRHYKFHTTEGRPFPCELCSLNYETKLDLLNHKCVQFPN